MSGAHDQICLWADHRGCAGADVRSNSTVAVRAEGQGQEIEHGRPCHKAAGWGLWRKGPGSLAPVELRSEV